MSSSNVTCHGAALHYSRSQAKKRAYKPRTLSMKSIYVYSERRRAPATCAAGTSCRSQQLSGSDRPRAGVVVVAVRRCLLGRRSSPCRPLHPCNACSATQVYTSPHNFVSPQLGAVLPFMDLDRDSFLGGAFGDLRFVFKYLEGALVLVD
jgi:hypothetical protein